jgi:hypothetical protein
MKRLGLVGRHGTHSAGLDEFRLGVIKHSFVFPSAGDPKPALNSLTVSAGINRWGLSVLPRTIENLAEAIGQGARG